ncbi:MAG TPA: deoxynucleoside kinase [Planctomycetota bacterium]|nr:deoxynucleoside kinase [Planctomycetota bacterium]HRR80828.1 deoxynucleoside kinase [Planctomycetota bacterium]HRT97199.1 deoxynucleoside kinase [Planctomycetota bacterium]
MSRKFTYIAVEGPIGVGKTTLALALGKALDARVILEESEANPFLLHFYENPARYAFQTQLFFLASRYKQQQEIFQRDLFHQTTVTDYLFEKDSVFASVTLSDEELRLYHRFASYLASGIPKPNIAILLQASVESLMARIRKRGHDFEAPMEVDYLRKVVETYNRHFFDYSATPLLVVNTDEVNVAADPAELANLIEQMGRLESGVQFYAPVARKGR